MTSSKSPLSQNPGLLGSIGLPCASGIRTIKTVPRTHARIFTAGHDTPRRGCFQTPGGRRPPPPSFPGFYQSEGGVGGGTPPPHGAGLGGEGEKPALPP